MPCLDTLKAKYDWIREPVPQSRVQARAPEARPRTSGSKREPCPRFIVDTEPSDDEDRKRMQNQLQAMEKLQNASLTSSYYANPGDKGAINALKKASPVPIQEKQRPAPEPEQRFNGPAIKHDFGDDPMTMLDPDGNEVRAEKLQQCEFCGRRFAAKALEKHVRLCPKNPDRAKNIPNRGKK